MAANTTGGVILIRNGRVYDHAGNVDLPPVADVLIVDGVIAAIRAGMDRDLARGQAIPELGTRRIDQTIEAHDKLVMPGFVNAHYHSHDVLLKGCFETIPLELWLLNALPPAYPKRSTAEICARTLLGALECLRSGMTTVQDLATIYPFDEEHLEAILQAYEDIGIRCIFALQFADMPGAKAVPFWEEVVPPQQRAALSGSVEPFQGIDLPRLLRDIVKSQRGRHPRITLALGPTSPERCTPEILSKLADISGSEDVPVYTHIYESRPMALIARQTHAADGGSLINYLRRVGLLGPRLSLAHSVWMSPSEIDAIAQAGTNVVLNPVGNLKTCSGVAPIRTYLRKGVRVALGCDNCSCSDAQNMFQSMKLYAALAAVTQPEPGPPTAADAIWSATIGGARTAGLGGKDRRAAAGHGGRPAHSRSHRSFVRPAQQRGSPGRVHRSGPGRGNGYSRWPRRHRRSQDHDHRRARLARGGGRADEGVAQGHRSRRSAQQCHAALPHGGSAQDLAGGYRCQSLCRQRKRLRTDNRRSPDER